MIDSFSLIDLYEHNNEAKSLTAESLQLFDELLTLLNQIAPFDEIDHGHALWLNIDRGSFEEWKKLDFVKSEFENFSDEKLYDAFTSYYPYEKYWFKLITYYNNEYNYKSLGFGRFSILLQNSTPEIAKRDFDMDVSEFLIWAIKQVKATINNIEHGTYNDTVITSLPYYYKYGYVQRKIYWEHYPDDKEEHVRDLKKSEIDKFIALAKAQFGSFVPHDRIKNISFMQYFNYAATAYKAANFAIPTSDVIKLFFKYGEDFGSNVLYHIDYTSTKDFDDYYHDWLGAVGGHPWGIVRGSSRGRILLVPHCDENGYYFNFLGDPYFRLYEMIKMYLALSDLGLPLRLGMPEQMVSILEETDYIGFVPHARTVLYAEGNFKGLDVHDFRHYYQEENPDFYKHITWMPLNTLSLAQKK